MKGTVVALGCDGEDTAAEIHTSGGAHEFEKAGFVGDLAEGTSKAESLTQPRGRVLTARLAATTFTLACHDPSRSLIVAISVT
jgi:hypothetical protein